MRNTPRATRATPCRFPAGLELRRSGRPAGDGVHRLRQSSSSTAALKAGETADDPRRHLRHRRHRHPDGQGRRRAGDRHRPRRGKGRRRRWPWAPTSPWTPSAEDFDAVAKADGGVDVILDMVAGPYFPKNIEALKTGGRLVHIAAQAGGTVELADPEDHAKAPGHHRLDPAAHDRPTKRPASPRRSSGSSGHGSPRERLKPVIDRVFPLAEAAAAHGWLEGGQHVGKVMLTP